MEPEPVARTVAARVRRLWRARGRSAAARLLGGGRSAPPTLKHMSAAT
jgi:hypothetical protein